MMVQVVGDVSGIGSFEWRILNWKSWMNEKMDIIESPSFHFWNATWHLELFYSIYKKKILLYVVRDTCERDTQVIALKLSARKSDKTEYTISEDNFEFTEDNKEHESVLMQEDLLNNKLAPDGNLTISCIIYRNRSIANAENQSTSSKDGQKCTEEKDGSMKKDRTIGDVIEKCPKLTGIDKLATDFKNLLITEEDSDVSIKVKDREFKAHKIILRARSSVFYSMFKHDMEEKSTGTVEIVDCDPEAFQNFLRYIYTGYVEDLSNDIVTKLYCVADKYDAQEVKIKCVEFMTNNLFVETFCDVVTLALKHDESALLETATEFFCKYIKEIIVTVQWQSFLKENTVAANELHIKALDNYVIPK